jgi:hypothetical protein
LLQRLVQGFIKLKDEIIIDINNLLLSASEYYLIAKYQKGLKWNEFPEMALIDIVIEDNQKILGGNALV